MNCEFSDIINLESSVELPAQWSFSKFACENATLESIQNTTTGAQFYLDKRLSYGEILVVVFLTIFLILIICKAIAGFVFNRS